MEMNPIKEGYPIYPERHPSTQHMMKVLTPNPNLNGLLFEIADNARGFAERMIEHHELPDGPELTAGLRKLLEAKDCFIRAALDSEPVDYRDR